MRETGRKTSEFWVTFLVIALGAATTGLGQFYGENLPEWARAVTIAAGSIMTILAALGYQAARTVRKNNIADNAVYLQTAEQDVKKAEAEKIAAIAQTKIALARAAEEGSASIGGVLGIVTLVLLFTIGCSLQMKAFDPVTVRQIDMTIEHYEQNADWIREQVPDRAVEVDLRKKAEVTRLEKWLEYERAKELTDAE